MLLLLILFAGSALAAPRQAEGEVWKFDSNLKMIFEDEFNEIDPSVWQHERSAGGGGNWEFQYYENNRSNSWTEDGVLYIKPTLTSDKFDEGFLSTGRLDLWGGNDANTCTGNEFWGCERVGNPTNIINPIQSARLRSQRGFSLKYGQVEVRAKLPKGDWLWPAIWMLPKSNEYGDWPASGEIDLMESRGNLDMRNEDGVLMGHQHAGQTMHWGPYFPFNGFEKTTGWREDDFADSFHLYQLDWTPEGISMYIDGIESFSVGTGFWELGGWGEDNDIDNPWKNGGPMAPFDKEFHFMLNVAVGGTNGYFPDGWTNSNGEKPWSNQSPQAMLDFWNARNDWGPTWNGNDIAMAVDYIRVAEYDETTYHKAN